MKKLRLILAVTAGILLSGCVLYVPCSEGADYTIIVSSNSNRLSFDRSPARLGAWFGAGWGVYDSTTNWAREISAAKELGIGLVRTNTDIWDKLQPTAKTFDFTLLDTLVDTTERNGMDLILTFPISAPWNRPAGTDSHTPTTDLNAYARMVRAVVSRYRGRIKYYECWNEPDFHDAQGNGIFWKPKPDPVAYAAMLKVMVAEVRKEDPDALVMNGGLALPADSTFARGIPADVWASLDMVNVHIYPAFATPMAALSMVADVVGPDKPVIVTETSSTGAKFDTTDRAAEERKKAFWLVNTYQDLLARRNVVAVVWHSLRNPDGYDFGLMDKDWNRLPAYTAFLEFQKRADYTLSTDAVDVLGSTVAKTGEPIYVRPRP